ncbi:MAG TPA: YetF domain-containing protein [Candidatus Tectomicrobia bacterium]|nr:YetF domain-containing protein [Candidatus Tectomicrobia bacterium]
MDSVLRAAAIYLFLLVLFRVAGKRTLSNVTTFDFVLLLIIGEATQQALLGEDFSLTNAFLVIVTLIGFDIGLSLWIQRWPWLSKWMEGVPLIIVEHGQPLRERMQRVRVSEDEILTAARERQGLARMDQIQYAVLERSGGISIIPMHDS